MNMWLQSAYEDFLAEHEIDPDEQDAETMGWLHDAFVAGVREAGQYACQALLDGTE